MDGSTTQPTQRSVETTSGRINYIERGKGPVALFVHGVLLNSHLWRHQLADLSDFRRCIALDLLAHVAVARRHASRDTQTRGAEGRQNLLPRGTMGGI